MALFDEFEWARFFYSTTVDNEFIEINRDEDRATTAPDNQLAVEFARARTGASTCRTSW
jgi:hypothetical protein